ncbi:MAG: hypothetical protein ABI345_09625 [Jatrophihabitans sp.]
MTPELLVLHCPTCVGERLTEVPPCADGHGDQCPDRACVECGTALLLDAQLVQLVSGPSSRRAA